MDDSLLMCVMDGVGQRFDESRGLHWGLGRATDDVRQAAPRHVFEHQVWLGRDAAAVGQLAELINLDQIGVPEPGDRPGLLEESLALFRVGSVGVAQELDCHVAVQRGLPSLVDHPHAAGTEDIDQLQAGNDRPVRWLAFGDREAGEQSGGVPRSVTSRRALRPGGEAVALPAGPVERGQLLEQDLANVSMGRGEVAGRAWYRASCPGFLPGLLETIADCIDMRHLVRG
jgi:hypothetical protein